MGQNLWERERRKVVMEEHTQRQSIRAHHTLCRAELCPVRTPMLWAAFFLSWISQKIGITVSFLYQTKYGHYAIKLVKKYQSLSNSPEMLWWLVLVKPWLHLIGCRVPRWNIFNPDFWVCLWGCFQMRLAWGKQTALPNEEEHHPPWWGPE